MFQADVQTPCQPGLLRYPIEVKAFAKSGDTPRITICRNMVSNGQFKPSNCRPSDSMVRAWFAPLDAHFIDRTSSLQQTRSGRLVRPSERNSLDRCLEIGLWTNEIGAVAPTRSRPCGGHGRSEPPPRAIVRATLKCKTSCYNSDSVYRDLI